MTTENHNKVQFYIKSGAVKLYIINCNDEGVCLWIIDGNGCVCPGRKYGHVATEYTRSVAREFKF